ncbi:unnamed protein product [Protopolystoma xenopodis]|uniref:Uncharacterized protein n=1 Tax=Protopolystoma xenopodis TaxID=117903 RepID=A0A448XQV3_9PLAT|nr:unnamed protein product [Protopolystoma xenopodis]
MDSDYAFISASSDKTVQIWRISANSVDMAADELDKGNWLGWSRYWPGPRNAGVGNEAGIEVGIMGTRIQRGLSESAIAAGGSGTSAITTDGLYTSGTASSISIQSVDSLSAQFVFREHKKPVFAAYLFDHRHVASLDGSLIVWDPNTGQKVSVS